MNYLEENQKIWNQRSRSGNHWSIFVSQETVELAKHGIWSIQ